VSVAAGQLLTIDAGGRVHFLSADPNAVAAPNGTPSRYLGCGGASFCGALVARIGSGAPFYVGTHFAQTVSSSGAVQLGVNDFQYTGNTGGFDATIQVSTPVASPRGGAAGASPTIQTIPTAPIPASSGSHIGVGDTILVLLILGSGAATIVALERRKRRGSSS